MSPLKLVTVKARRGVVAAVLVAALLLPVATWIAASRVSDNCEGIHRIVTVGAKIIDGRERLRNQLKLGLISRAEYRDRLIATRQALAVWRSADCK